jgi:hypothetical protein
MEQSPSNLPLVPHYGANNNQYYTNYLSPQQYPAQQTQDPPQPAQPLYPPQQTLTPPPHFDLYQQPTVTTNQRPPSSESPLIIIEFPPELSTENAGFQQSVVASQERAWAQTHPAKSSPPPAAQLAVQRDSDVSAHIIASQERALAEIRLQQTTSNNASQALTVPLQVPRSSNPNGSDSIHPQKKGMKQVRKGKTAAGVAGGAVVGGVLFGPAFPVGMVLGGAVGGYATNKISKAGERRVQRKWEQQNFQRGAQESLTIQHEGSFV